MMQKFLLFTLCLVFAPLVLFAQTTSDFTVSTTIVDDLIPPTTPTLLSVVPVAATQIDINWSASTDNYLMGGYVLLRDGTPIATTSLISYIDAGLTASTTYSYEVYAFDTFFNLSTTSNSLSTTTLQAPVAPPVATSTPTTGSATLVLQLRDFSITPALNTATFNWQTNTPARFALRWGRSDSYDKGYIINDVYRSSQQTLVSDLEPGTIYLYELIGYSASGIAISLQKGQFKTEARENSTTPNVRNLQATVSGSDVSLRWDSPFGSSESTVRIIRSHLGYPVDPYDGAVVYEGNQSTFTDRGAFETYENQYYTVFVIGIDGTVSSGAVVRARAETLPIGGGSIGTDTGTGNTIPSSTSTTTPTIELPIEEETIPLLDFGFAVNNIKLNQGDKSFDFGSERIYLSSQEAFIISIPFEALPQNLKSIVVTLLDPTNYQRSYSFLLRINKDRTAYEATIAPLGVVGISRLQVEIFDFERQIIGRYSKQIDIVLPKEFIGEVIFPDKIIDTIKPFFGTASLLLFLMFLIIFFLYIRSRQAEDKL